MKLVTFDFETDPIEAMPEYPPKPQGLALMLDRAPFIKGYYHAWGHPEGNNATEAHTRELVGNLVADKDTFWVAHNLAFDAAITIKHWGIDFPWERSACTMLKAFLHNPYGDLSLKPLAHKLLGMAPEEQEDVRQWLVRRGVCRSNDKAWGAHICKAPADLVGRYAFGDIDRTEKLYHYLEAQA